MTQHIDIPENKKSDFPQKFPIGPDPLSKEKLERILEEELVDWKIIKSPLPEDPTSDRFELFREYNFEDFDKVMEYMGKVAIGCNIFPHHPRWVNTWTILRVYLSTWDIAHIISYKDIMLARYMDRVYQQYSNFNDNIHSKDRLKREKDNFIKKIREFIKDDNLEKAFEHINSYIALNPELNERNELIMIINRFAKNQREKRMGATSLDITKRETLLITSDLLETLNDL